MSLPQNVQQRLTALLFPARCLACHQALSDPAPGATAAWCDACRHRLLSKPDLACPRCGAELPGARLAGGPCRLCRGLAFRFDAAVALGNYQGLMRQLVIEMKRCHDETLAYQFGRLLGLRLQDRAWTTPIEGLVPVPTFWLKRIQAGFHAAAVIADGVADQLGVGSFPRVVTCTRRTQKQGTLETPDRIRNVRSAFRVVRTRTIRGKHLVIVDDVMTSGATANEVSRVLLEAGAESVRLAIIARGIRAKG